MTHPIPDFEPSDLEATCAFVRESLRRWRLESDWIVDGPMPDPQALDVDARLRARRQLESVRILWRDVSGQADLERTGHDLSRLAEDCLEEALEAAESEVAKRAGELGGPGGRRQRLCVIGLGKLGGDELNFNSDLDLVFVHDAGGESAGPRKMPAREYLGQVARALIRRMDAVTEHGRCWIIDTRLRPFGQAGALVWSLEAMEQYFVNEGRSWERYAWMKARPVAGDLAIGEELIRRLQPFIFRRYLDYGLFDSLRKLHTEIDRKGRQEDFENDIKRGPGGIRELEFLVQSMQLLRGGRDRALTSPNFLNALARARARNLFPDDQGAMMEAGYRFLRILENRLQAVTGRQTHDLPATEDHRQRLARIMAEDHWAGLEDSITRTRREVAGTFRSRFQEPDGEGGDESSLWPPPDDAGDRLKASGFEQPEAAARALARLAHRIGNRALSAEGRRRLDRLMPALLAEVQSHRPPDPGFDELMELLESIVRRSAYLSLLQERPQTLTRLVRVFRRSPRAARWIIASPHLLDDLLDPVNGFGLPDPPTMNPDDPEASLEALGRFRQAGFVRTALGQLDGSLDQATARVQLTELAERVLASSLELVVGPSPPLAVIGYGNLGAGELHYSSDLDLVFLHAEGDPPLRPAQRLVNAMQLPLAGGKLYEIDTRLRPNGNAGLLVSTLSSFEDYQQQHAWTWEHQALIRARWVAGDPGLAEPLEAVRRKVLCQRRDPDETRTELIQMRQRQRRERTEDPVKALLTDIQFIAELGMLLQCAENPDLAGQRQTLAQLEGLGRIGWLGKEQSRSLIEAARAAGAVRDRTFLEREPGEGLSRSMTENVRSAWTEVFGDPDPERTPAPETVQ